jgi:hypothetical protein
MTIGFEEMLQNKLQLGVKTKYTIQDICPEYDGSQKTLLSCPEFDIVIGKLD